MTVIAKPLIKTKLMETAITSQYLTPERTKTIVDKLTVCNTGGDPSVLSIYLVQNGGIPDDSTTVIWQKSIAPNETYSFFEVSGHVLEQSDQIFTNASASGVTIRASGREIS